MKWLMPLLLAAVSAQAAEIRVETNAKTTPAGENWVCSILPFNDASGGLAGGTYQCTGGAPRTVTVAELQAPAGAVILRSQDRDVLIARLAPDFALHQDGYVTLTYLKSGVTNTYADLRLHLYLVGTEWVARVVDLPSGEQDFERLCAVKNTVLGKVVGIRKFELPAGGRCEF
jgi:hypothetical protein